MYTTTHASSPGADGLWAAFSALRLLQDAEDTIAVAASIGSDLVADSTWSSEGVGARSLREALAQVHRQVRSELVAVQEQQGVVRAGVR